MIQDRIAHRYAESLYSVAADKGQADAVLSDLQGIQQLIASNKDFRALVNSPIITHEQKRPIFQKLFQNKVAEPTMNLLELLASRGREELLSFIVSEYTAVYNTANGILPVQLTSAVELPQAVKDDIITKLEAAFPGMKVQLHEGQDAALIGGFVLNLGDKHYDGSVQGALKRARRQLRAH